MAVFVLRGGVGQMSIALFFGGAVVLSLLWFTTRPLWRVGHGARLRQMHSVEIPWKNFGSFSSSQG